MDKCVGSCTYCVVAGQHLSGLVCLLSELTTTHSNQWNAAPKHRSLRSAIHAASLSQPYWLGTAERSSTAATFADQMQHWRGQALQSCRGSQEAFFHCKRSPTPTGQKTIWGCCGARSFSHALAQITLLSPFHVHLQHMPWPCLGLCMTPCQCPTNAQPFLELGNA